MNEGRKVNIHAALEMFTSGQLLFLGLFGPVKMDFCLCSRGPALKQGYGINLQVRSIGKCWTSWGYTPQKPIKHAYCAFDRDHSSAETPSATRNLATML